MFQKDIAFLSTLALYTSLGVMYTLLFHLICGDRAYLSVSAPRFDVACRIGSGAREMGLFNMSASSGNALQ